jgi:uncharacterized protein (DUF1330 family)
MFIAATAAFLIAAPVLAQAPSAAPAPAAPPAAERPAYLLVQATVTDRAKFGQYIAALGPVYAKFNGAPIASVPAARVESIEGAPENRSIVISKFPSKAALLAFWNSPDYAEVRKLREGTGTFSVQIVEGNPPVPPQAASPR